MVTGIYRMSDLEVVEFQRRSAAAKKLQERGPQIRKELEEYCLSRRLCRLS